MDRRIVARVVDRLSDLLHGPGGASMEGKKREELEEIHSLWTKVEDILKDVSTRPPGEQIRLLSQSQLLNINRIGLHVDSFLDTWDEWQARAHHHHQDQVSRSTFFPWIFGRCSRQPGDSSVLGDVRGVVDYLKKVSSMVAHSEFINHWVYSSDAKSLALKRFGGRRHELKRLQNMIKSLSKHNCLRPQVICIRGEKGVGKSSVANTLYHSITGFDIVSWAGMPSGSFDVKEISNQILYTSYNPNPDTSDIMWLLFGENAARIEESELIDLWGNFFHWKRVLLIIDDLEKVECSEWESFVHSHLRACASGSVILVTTRSEAVVKGIRSVCTVDLLPLTSDDRCEALIIMLLEALEISKSTLLSMDTTIIWDIAQCSRGMPELLQNYVAALKDLGPQEWTQLFNNDTSSIAWFRDLPFIENLDTYYRGLSPQLQRCISCCARYPEDALINVDQLVALWMAKGYLHSPHSPPLDEDDQSRETRGFETFYLLARDFPFFKELVRSSIHTNKVTGCKMDDHFHHFAMHMAACDVAWRGQNFVYDRAASNSTEVRDTCLFYSHSQSLPPSLFTHWKYVRFLVLSFCNLAQLPTEVENMILLQYLDLSGNPLKQLPKNKCRWYSLHSLDVSFCYLLLQLPRWIGELQRLQHLKVKYTTDELHNLPREFEKLTLIRTMDYFRIGGAKYKSNAEKFKKLNNLKEVCLAVHGELVDFSGVNLGSKTAMVNLELCFTGEGRDQEKASSVMRVFKPPPNLEMLKLKDYPGLRLPKWIQAKSLVDNLKRLSIRSAVSITTLPTLWKLSSLEFLWLYGLPNIKHLGHEFFGILPENLHQFFDGVEDISDDDDDDDNNDDFVPTLTSGTHTETFRCLRTLRIEYLKNWEGWEDANDGEELKTKVMPCLEELIIVDCPKLQEKPLCILSNTPWFKATYPVEVQDDTESNDKNTLKPPFQESASRPENITEEPNEKNTMRPPSEECASVIHNKYKEVNGVSEASYMKFKKFVRDALTTNPSKLLEVLVPEGVSGNTMAPYFLPLDALHDWLEKNRSMFADQLFVWSKIIYKLMTPSDKERVQIANSALITAIGNEGQPGIRSKDLVDFMIENKAKLYLVPLLRPGHWELLAFVPEIEVIYRFDSQQGSISPAHTEFLDMVETKYNNEKAMNSTIVHNRWKVVDIKHKKQSGNWECGFYVMLWMQKIALQIQDLNLESHFPIDDDAYTPEDLEKVGWEWCEHVLQFVPEFSSS